MYFSWKKLAETTDGKVFLENLFCIYHFLIISVSLGLCLELPISGNLIIEKKEYDDDVVFCTIKEMILSIKISDFFHNRIFHRQT